MNNLKKYWLPGFLLLIGACDGSILDELSPSYFEARFENTTWQGRAYAIDSPFGFTIGGIRGDTQSGNYGEITFTLISNFSGNGTYQIQGDGAWVGTIIGGDGISVYLRGMDAEENKLVIDRYDDVSGIIEGRFEFQSRHAGNSDGMVKVSGQLIASIERRGWTE